MIKVNELALEKARIIVFNRNTSYAARQKEERDFSMCISNNVCPACAGNLLNEVRQVHWTTTLWVKRYYRASFKKCESCKFEINYTEYIL